MRRFCRFLICIAALLVPIVPALCETRALLVACSDFISHPDLGNATSGNLHMIGSALLGATPSLARLSIEDGTVGTPDALQTAIDAAFTDAQEGDLSILYLCTHGVLSSSDDGQVYLLLGDGKTESPLGSDTLYEQLSSVSGDKLLILDACHSGALLGRHIQDGAQLSDAVSAPTPFLSPFLADTSMHVLTSAAAGESSWYYDGEGLQTGAVSYFASALSSGLGLYGSAEADLNGDGQVTLLEMHRHLGAAVPSSSSQLLSARAGDILLPAAQGAMLSRPLSGFSYGTSLLTTDLPTLDFSFTVTKETAVQYRLTEYEDGAWNWSAAQTFLDAETMLSPGRHARSLTLPEVKPEDSGYLMLQVFSVSGSELLLCSERLIAVQPVLSDPELTLSAPDVFLYPGASELPIVLTLGAPAEMTVTVYDAQGEFIRRLSFGQLTRPSADNTLHLYWDGRDENGVLVPAGAYTIAAETRAGFRRIKATTDLLVSGG